MNMSKEIDVESKIAEHREVAEQMYETHLGKVRFFLTIEPLAKERGNRFQVKSCKLKSHEGTCVELTDF